VTIPYSLISGRTDWWIILELKDGTMHDLTWAGKPFKGTVFQKDCYVEQLAEQAMLQGLPVKEIHVWPILRSK
jgi:hypothetical protein